MIAIRLSSRQAVFVAGWLPAMADISVCAAAGRRGLVGLSGRSVLCRVSRVQRRRPLYRQELLNIGNAAGFRWRSEIDGAAYLCNTQLVKCPS